MNVNPSIGLTADQVASFPKNESLRHQSNFQLMVTVLKNQVLSFFFLLLIVSGGLSFFLGEKVDASIFFSIAFINAIIGFFQEYRANKGSQLLEKIIEHTVTVRRDGKLVRIPHFEVVLNDIMIVVPGDVLVADVVIISGENIFLDQSVVTGETLPRQVFIGDTVASGVSLSSGSFVSQVCAVGNDSSLLKYAEKISKVQKSNNFEKFLNTISIAIMVVTVGCLLVVFIINVLILHGMPIPQYILFAISMLVGVVPESLPLIVTIILTKEAVALSKQHVLVKKLSVLQNLGGMNFLFTDKTGTLTENNLTVTQVIDCDGTLEASLKQISEGSYERTPMDLVFDQAIKSHFPTWQADIVEEPLKLSPFQVERGYAEYVTCDKKIILRGQYRSVAKMCQSIPENFFVDCILCESKGMRVIALAIQEGDDKPRLQGAVIFEDPLKPDAVTLYNSLEELDVSVKVITGDSLEVAEYIGNKLRGENRGGSQFARTMEGWNSQESSNIENYSVYARCKPEQKSDLITEHLDQGTVGFLGEGINDAMALKRADIGFVVSNASDVARQSADVILLEKSLDPILTAIMMSRKSFVRIRTYLLCTLTGNIGTLFSLTTVVVFWNQIPMLPIQILLNNLLTDLPLTFLITDAISEESLKKPIKSETRSFVFKIILFAAISSVFDFIFFFIFRSYGIETLRTGWFVFSVLAELTLVFSLRSELSILKAPSISKILTWILIACYLITIALPYSPLSSLFKLVPLSGFQVGIIVGVTVIYLFVNELFKWIERKKKLQAIVA